jgi:hypothetical protein
MRYTLGTAAQAAGVAKSTLSRAIHSGKLSAERQDDGSYAIDASELHRVFPPQLVEQQQIERSATPSNGHATDPIRELQAERERERAQFVDTITDLRKRLDVADEERRRLTAILADGRAAPSRRWWRFGR